MSISWTIFAGLVALALAVSAAPAAAGATTSADWKMEGCHGLATLALAPRDKVQASLPDGYEAQNAATFVLPGDLDTPSLLSGSLDGAEQGLVGMEIWKCDSIHIGGVTVKDAVYGSTAAVVERPADAPEASLYFYKYENFFNAPELVQQSQRLGAPASLVTDVHVENTLSGAKGSLNLADGGRYALTTADLGDMGSGNFQEWHHGDKGVSNWHAGFTTNPGKQGTGTLEAPSGSKVADVMGASSGDGLGIHTHSSFSGGIALTR